MLRIISLKKKKKVVHFCTQRGTCVSVNSDLDLMTKQQQNVTYGVDGP